MTKAYQNFNKLPGQMQAPIPGREKDMARNNAGGFVFKGGPWLQYSRFLIIGSEGGTFYQGENELTIENAKSITDCLKANWRKAIDMIVEVSDKALAVSNDPALFALAIACSTGNPDITRYAMSVLPKVARIGTHILHFVSYVDGMRSWGRAIRSGVGKWYTGMDVNRLAYQMGKYRSRDGWSHGDAILSAHLKIDETLDPARAALIRWAVANPKKPYNRDAIFGLPAAVEEMSNAKDVIEVCSILARYNAPMEIVPTEYKKERMVWLTALPNLGIAAIIRNLGNMTSYGVLDSKETVNYIAEKIKNLDVLRKSRLHPFKIMCALKQYDTGTANYGEARWIPNPSIQNALEHAFYNSFPNVEPTGKRIALCLDVSGSMDWEDVPSINMTPRTASAVMAMVNYRVEENSLIWAFSHKMQDVNIYKTDSLNDVVRTLKSIPMGGTNCDLPMITARENRIPVDAFVIYTDDETWAGDTHPAQELEAYRESMSINSKLVVVGMTSTNFTIADQLDPFQIDVAGISSGTPSMISSFIKIPDNTDEFKSMGSNGEQED